MNLDTVRKPVSGWRGKQLLPMWGQQKKEDPPLKTTGEVPLVEQASRTPVLEPLPGKRSPRWLHYIFLIVASILLFGLLLPPASRVSRPVRRAADRDSHYYIPPDLDCVRVVSSPTSGVLPGALDELRRIGLHGPPAVQQLRLAPANHKRGCHNAHLEAHRWAVKSNCTHTLVIEDDAVFADDMTDAWTSVARLFRSGRPVDTIWLGYVGIRLDATSVPGIVHLQKPMLSHAVIYSRDTSRRIVGLPPWRPRSVSVLEAYDVNLWHSGATRVGATFGVYPPAAAQLASRPSSLSLDKNGVQDWIKTFTGMRFFASLAYGTCSSLYRLSPYLSAILGTVMEMPPDSLSLQKIYTCATPVALDSWA